MQMPLLSELEPVPRVTAYSHRDRYGPPIWPKAFLPVKRNLRLPVSHVMPVPRPRRGLGRAAIAAAGPQPPAPRPESEQSEHEDELGDAGVDGAGEEGKL